MTPISAKKLISLQDSIIKTIIVYYNIKPDELDQYPEILEALCGLVEGVFEINEDVNEICDYLQASKTRLVEKNGNIFRVIEGG